VEGGGGIVEKGVDVVGGSKGGSEKASAMCDFGVLAVLNKNKLKYQHIFQFIFI
jgi:hypothetical protein